MTPLLLRSTPQVLRYSARRQVVNPSRRSVGAMVHLLRASGQDSGHYILQYSYVPDVLEKRGPYREGHLNGIKKLIAENKIVIAGAIADPVDGGLLIFANSTKDEVEAYAKADPYYEGGLIASYSIRPYLTVK